MNNALCIVLRYENIDTYIVRGVQRSLPIFNKAYSISINSIWSLAVAATAGGECEIV